MTVPLRLSNSIETNNNIHTVQGESSGVKLTRFQIEGWIELMPSVDILHRSDCAWLCRLLSQFHVCVKQSWEHFGQCVGLDTKLSTQRLVKTLRL